MINIHFKFHCVKLWYELLVNFYHYPHFLALHALSGVYPISTLPEHLHSTSLSHAETT